MPEILFNDLSAGMNSSVSVDQIPNDECLLAENVRLDEQGNLAMVGAAGVQNTSTYTSSLGNSVHSLYYNKSIKAIGGVGGDVYQGAFVGSMTDVLAGSNSSQQKMSFASAINRVYYDVLSVGYWSTSGTQNPILVDWAPPAIAGGGNGTGTCSTAVTTGTGRPWLSPPNVNGTSAFTTVSLTTNSFVSQNLLATNAGLSIAASPAITGVSIQFNGNINNMCQVWASLVVGGVAVGNLLIANGSGINGAPYVLGGPTNLWGLSALTSAQVNAASFGVQLYALNNDSFAHTIGLNALTITVYTAGTGTQVGTGSAGTLTGTYTWKVTFVASNGEESDGSLDTASQVLSSQQGALTSVPTGDARTVARNIYRKGNALTAHYLVGSIPDNVTTSYNDNLSDTAALTEGVILAGDTPGDFANTRLGSQAVRFPCYHYDRIFWINPNTNTIIWSKPLNGFAYPVTNFIEVGDSRPCTGLVSIFGELFIFKTDSIWRLTGTDESSFNLSQTPSEVGTDQPFTIAALPDRIMFSNALGIWAFNGYTSTKSTTKLDLWFNQVDRTNDSLFGVNGFHPIEVVNTAVTQNFHAVTTPTHYYLSYAEVGQLTNNAILVLQIATGAMSKRATKALCLATDPLTGYVYYGTSTGLVQRLDDWTAANDNGNAVNMDFQTGYFNPAFGTNHSFQMIEFWCQTNGQSVTPYVYYDSGNASEALAPFSTPGPANSPTSWMRVQRRLMSGSARKAQNISVRVNCSSSLVNVNFEPQIVFNYIKIVYEDRVGRGRTGQ